MSKRVTILLIVILAVSSLVVVKAVPALASIPKLSVPEFTLNFAVHPYDVPTTYGIDPYTGKNVTIQEGYHVENKSIEVTIKNQPFAPYHDANGTLVRLYYCINFKGHFEDRTFDPNNTGSYFLPSDSDYTVVSFALGEDSPYGNLREIPFGGQIDFQVAATVGYLARIYGTPVPPWPESYFDVFISEASSLSNTQTLIIPTSTSSSSLQLAAIIGAVIAVAVVGAILLVYFKKRKR